LQTTPESRLRKAIPFVVDNDSIACSLGFGFRFTTAKRLPSFVQHSFRFHGVIQDTHVLALGAVADLGALNSIRCTKLEFSTSLSLKHETPAFAKRLL
jgi:hypothetical protein